MDKFIFDYLAQLFNENGFHLYMIGGTSRDFLLSLEVDDYDFTSDATPIQMKTFLVDADYTFARFGTVKIKINNQKVDITTLRKEDSYVDLRHPSKIEFTKNIEEDYLRRDFTINAIYIDKNYKIHDFSNGLKDLKDGIIRFIGDPDKRIQEDPLRILRAERFAKMLNFKIEEKSLEAIKRNYHLIERLNPQKVLEERKKLKKKFL